MAFHSAVFTKPRGFFVPGAGDPGVVQTYPQLGLDPENRGMYLTPVLPVGSSEEAVCVAVLSSRDRGAQFSQDPRGAALEGSPLSTPPFLPDQGLPLLPKSRSVGKATSGGSSCLPASPPQSSRCGATPRGHSKEPLCVADEQRGTKKPHGNRSPGDKGGKAQ